VASIVTSSGRVDGVEQHEALTEWASSRCALHPALYSLNFCTFVTANAFRVAAASSRNMDASRYDRIYVGGGVSAGAVDRFRDLLKVTGIMVAPRDDELVKIERLSAGVYRQSLLAPVRFASFAVLDEKSISLLGPVEPHLAVQDETVCFSHSHGISTSAPVVL
jgi:protein-L-isoaspartate O-methyltransferase